MHAYPYAGALRRELSFRNREYANRCGFAFQESVGNTPVICYPPSEDGACHGNFLPQSYQAIRKNPEWRKRLGKPHTSAYRALPRQGLRWRELDSSTSSDALLMNIFCFPGILQEQRACTLLGVERCSQPQFGFRARVPLANGRADRTEVDMRLGDLLVEAKLTESDFQKKSAKVVESYRDFREVFEHGELSRSDEDYLSYQLIRNVLAAHAGGCRFCVLLDARRPDLCEAWYGVMRCIRIHDLRLRCQVLSWQELAGALPGRLQGFLAEKYGIVRRQELASAAE